MDSSIFQRITINKLLFFFGLLSGVIVIYKAATLSFTHDESATYLIIQNHSFWDIFTDKGAWESANNHILNSVLYKLSIGIFGHSDFAMRLPNVLAFFGSFAVALFVIKEKLSSPSSKIVLFAFLFFNPFVLDFYSLCRGYGLSMFFHLAFLACIWHFQTTKKTRLLYLAFAFLLLACLSLFTSLVLFPAYTLAFWLLSRSQQFDRHQKKHLFLAPVIFGTLTLALIIQPIRFLMNSNELEFGVASIWDSFKSIILSSFNFLPRQDFMWVYDVLTALFLLALIYVFYRSFKTRNNRYFSISTLLLIVLLHVLCFGLGIMFPVDRKVTLYVPILALLFANQLNNYSPKNHLNIATITLALAASVLFMASNKLDRTTEWAYDRTTKDYLLEIRAQAQQSTKTVQTEWWFNPTAEYYLKTRNMKNIVLLPYNKAFDLSAHPDFVIAYKHQMRNNTEYRLLISNEESALYSRTTTE